MENNNGLIFLESVNPLQIKNSTIEDTKFGEKVTKNVFKIGLDNLQKILSMDFPKPKSPRDTALSPLKVQPPQTNFKFPQRQNSVTSPEVNRETKRLKSMQNPDSRNSIHNSQNLTTSSFLPIKENDTIYANNQNTYSGTTQNPPKSVPLLNPKKINPTKNSTSSKKPLVASTPPPKPLHVKRQNLESNATKGKTISQQSKDPEVRRSRRINHEFWKEVQEREYAEILASRGWTWDDEDDVIEEVEMIDWRSNFVKVSEHGRNFMVKKESNQPKKQCHICPDQFDNEISLWDHVIETHCKQDKHDCLICNVSFSRPMELHRHNVSNHYDIDEME